MSDRIPDDQLHALATEPLDGLPREVLAASVRYLAEQLIAERASNDGSEP